MLVNKAGWQLSPIEQAGALAKADAHNWFPLDDGELVRKAREVAESLSDHPYEQSLCQEMLRSCFIQELRKMANR